MTRDLQTLAVAALLSVGLAACGGAQPPTEELGLAAALPGEAALTVDVGRAEFASALQAVDESSNKYAMLADTGEVVRTVRGWLLRTASGGEKAVAPGRRELGPVTVCVIPDEPTCPEGAALTLVTVVARRGPVALGFVLRAKDAAGGAEWQEIAAGIVARDEMAGRSRGVLAVALGRIAAIAPAYAGMGVLTLGFAADPQETSIRHHLTAFAREGREPLSLSFVAHRSAAHGLRVRVNAGDVLPGPGGDELASIHVGWDPRLGSAGYAILANWMDLSGVVHGDVWYGGDPLESYWMYRYCFAAGEAAPRFFDVFVCPRADAPAVCVAREAPVAYMTDATTWDGACGFLGGSAETALPAAMPSSVDETSPEMGALDVPEPPAEVGALVAEVLGSGP